MMNKDKILLGSAAIEVLFRDMELAFSHEGTDYYLFTDEDADDGYTFDGSYHWVYPEFVCSLTGARFWTCLQGKGYDDIDWASWDGTLERVS